VIHGPLITVGVSIRDPKTQIYDARAVPLIRGGLFVVCLVVLRVSSIAVAVALGTRVWDGLDVVVRVLLVGATASPRTFRDIEVRRAAVELNDEGVLLVEDTALPGAFGSLQATT